MKTRSLLTLSILSVLAVASLVAYYFAYVYIENIGKKTSEESANLSYAEAKYDRSVSLKLVAASGKNSGERLDKYILGKGGEVAMVKMLERLASSLSLSYTTDALDTQENDTLSSQNKNFLHIVTTSNGTIQQNRRFLAVLESLPYNVKLNRVDMRDQGAESGGRWQMSVDFSIVEEKSSDVIQ